MPLAQVVMRELKEEQEEESGAAVGLKLWNSQSHILQGIILAELWFFALEKN